MNKITDSNCRRRTGKDYRDNTSVRRFLQGIRFVSQRKDEAHTTSILSPQRNFHSYNDTLQKHESNGSLIQLCHRLLQHRRSRLEKKYFTTISAYDMS